MAADRFGERSGTVLIRVAAAGVLRLRCRRVGAGALIALKLRFSLRNVHQHGAARVGTRLRTARRAGNDVACKFDGIALSWQAL